MLGKATISKDKLGYASIAKVVAQAGIAGICPTLAYLEYVRKS